jgi:hypothetical protein
MKFDSVLAEFDFSSQIDGIKSTKRGQGYVTTIYCAFKPVVATITTTDLLQIEGSDFWRNFSFTFHRWYLINIRQMSQPLLYLICRPGTTVLILFSLQNKSIWWFSKCNERLFLCISDSSTTTEKK